MKQYQSLLKDILENGVEKESGRENMPNTIGISQASMKFDLSDGFPLLTTKKMFLKGIIHELLWFLRGDTNIKYLVDNGVNIWNKDAYRWYLKHIDINNESPEDFIEPMSLEGFVETIKTNRLEDLEEQIWFGSESNYNLGDLGKVYGYQWRNQNGVDQIAELINGIQTNPYSRYHIVDGWNKADFPEMALPPCHLLYQFICRPKGDGSFILDLNMYQRSCDTFLGVPFNIASASLFLMIVAKACNMDAGVFTWLGGDTHLYVTHKEQTELLLSRETKDLPILNIIPNIKSLEGIEKLTINDFALLDYYHHPKIDAELSVGL